MFPLKFVRLSQVVGVRGDSLFLTALPSQQHRRAEDKGGVWVMGDRDDGPGVDDGADLCHQGAQDFMGEWLTPHIQKHCIEDTSNDTY